LPLTIPTFSQKIKAKNKSDKERKRTREEIPRGIETHRRGKRHREAERGCNRTRAPVLRWNQSENQNPDRETLD
jgi:hypothetical protein